MPFLGLAHMLVGVLFAIHAMKSGRPQYWLFILLMVPFVGSIAYVCFELLPELGQSQRARQVKQGVSDLIAPEREFNRLYDNAKDNQSVEARQALAAEYERKGMWADAIKLYASAAKGLYADDAVLLSKLARAHLENGTVHTALDTLERLKSAHPDIDDQIAHLTYARCLEDMGRQTEAEHEYSTLANYFIGLEARTRFGLFLQRRGNPAKARTMFESVVKAGGARGVVLSDDDRKWLRIAKANV